MFSYYYFFFLVLTVILLKKEGYIGSAKIWTNLNLNFPPHLILAIGCWRSNKSHICKRNCKMSEQIRSSAKYNRRATIIEGLHWAFADRNYSVLCESIVYDVAAKYLTLETFEKGSANLTRKSHSKEKSVRIPAIIKRAQELISELSLTKLAKTLGVNNTTMHRIAEKDLRFKSYVIKIRQMLSEVQNWLSNNMEMFWSKEF